jgi:hypothetical protein
MSDVEANKTALQAELDKLSKIIGDGNNDDGYLINSPESSRVYKHVQPMSKVEIADDNVKRIERGLDVKPGPYGTRYDNAQKVDAVVAKSAQVEQTPIKQEDNHAKQPIGFKTTQDEEDTVNAAMCTDRVMDARAHGGMYVDGSVESRDDDGPILRVPYFGDNMAIMNGQRVSLGTVFTPYFLRVYFACLVMWSDQKRKINGAFRLRNGIRDILDMMGVKKRSYVSESTGETLSVYRDEDVKCIKETLLRMNKITIRQFREKEVGHGDAMIEFYPSEIDDKNIEMMHARLVAGQLTNGFFQIPRHCIELPKDDIPYVIGISYMIRKKIVAYCLDKKPIEAPINEWLEACGQDVESGVRKYGMRAWCEARHRDIARIAAAMVAGGVTVEGTMLRLEPTDQTVRTYDGLLQMVEQKRVARKSTKKSKRTEDDLPF